MASYLTHHVFGQMWMWQAMHTTPASYLPPEKLAVHARGGARRL